jgi:hypothetical protein
LGNGFTVNTTAAYVHSGAFSFTPGIFGPAGAWNHELRQDIDVSAWSTAIDAGTLSGVFSGFGRSNEGSGIVDPGEVLLEFRGSGGALLGNYGSGVFLPTNTWIALSDTRLLPVGTRTLRLRLRGTRTIGQSTDCFFDDLSLSVGCGASTYCTAKLNSQGCTSAIGYSGVASASAGSGFLVNAAGMINNKSCLLFYGTTGPAGVAFQGGTLCVKAPVKRTPATNTGGNPPPNDCSGQPSIDMNLFAAGGLGGTPLPALTIPGTVVDCQWWGRDPGFGAPNNTQLTNGLQYTICE